MPKQRGEASAAILLLKLLNISSCSNVIQQKARHESANVLMNSDRRIPGVRSAAAILLCVSGLALSSCATTAPRSTRVKDSPAEKSAAQNAGDPHAESEATEQRWGFDAARDRKRRSDEEKRKLATTPPPGGPVDLKQQPAPNPTP